VIAPVIIDESRSERHNRVLQTARVCALNTFQHTNIQFRVKTVCCYIGGIISLQREDSAFHRFIRYDKKRLWLCLASVIYHMESETKLEEVGTHKSAKTLAGTVFLCLMTLTIDLLTPK